MGFFFGQNQVFSNTLTFTQIKYGYLYNWYAASNAKFAPVGWHVPTQAEFETLLNYIDIYDSETSSWPLAGGKLKETGLTYWNDPNEGATNEYGFNMRGSGYRGWNIEQLPMFSSIENYGDNWIIDSVSTEIAKLYDCSYNSGECLITEDNKKVGFGIRLIKDDSTLVPSLTDIDGNVYRTTKIGNQVWLADNWACTKLNDGTPIPNVTDNAEWAALTTGAYCNYNNDINNVFL